MVQTRPQLNTFAEYLAYSDQLEGFYELVDGVLVELPPESGINVRIANRLFLLLVSQGIRDPLITSGRCELQVPSLQPKDPQNRFPDLARESLPGL